MMKYTSSCLTRFITIQDNLWIIHLPCLPYIAEVKDVTCKRFRCYSHSDSPIWSSSSLNQLRTAFPHLELTVLVKAIEDHGSDFNAAMKNLCPLVSAEESRSHDDVLATALDNLPTSKRSGGFREGVKCTALDEARQKLQEETVAVQQQVESLIKDNALLKCAVAIHHERHNALEDAKQQLELLKQLIPQYQEKMRNLKVNKLRLKFNKWNTEILCRKDSIRMSFKAGIWEEKRQPILSINSRREEM